MLRIYFRRLGLALCLLIIIHAVQAQYIVTGGRGTPMMAYEDTSSKLQVYLVWGMDNVEISYSSSSTSHKWYRYKTKMLEAEAITGIQEGTTSRITNIQEGYGYYVEESDKMKSYVWIIDYSKYAFDVSGLRVSGGSDPCSGVQFEGQGKLARMGYNLPQGGTRYLSREFQLRYTTMEYLEDRKVYANVDSTETKTIVAANAEGTLIKFTAGAPLCDTEYTLSGDQYARHFGVEKTITTDLYTSVSVEVHADTTLTMTDAPNINTGKEGYNAPATIQFSAVANPTASLYIWSIYKMKDLIDTGNGGEGSGSGSGDSNNGNGTTTQSIKSKRVLTRAAEGDDSEEQTGTLLVRFTGEQVEYTFTEAGIYKALIEVHDPSGTCTATEEYEIIVSVSFLDVPNVFSPGMSPGINDEFRVAYKSLVRFNAWVFNRWGKELFHWNDPAKGWDGKKGGKYVAPGVYYYVIEAVGSDGKKYKKAGDINILRSKTVQTEVIEDDTDKTE